MSVKDPPGLRSHGSNDGRDRKCSGEHGDQQADTQPQVGIHVAFNTNLPT
jgi:hypothetical protein